MDFHFFLKNGVWPYFSLILLKNQSLPEIPLGGHQGGFAHIDDVIRKRRENESELSQADRSAN